MNPTTTEGPTTTRELPTNTPPEQSGDVLIGLRSLQEGTPLSEIEATLREIGENLWSVDALTMTRIRAEMITELSRLGVQSPARWADSVISPPASASGSGTQGTSLAFEDPTPWPEPVDGEGLLDELADTFRRHVVVHNYGVEAVSLWALLTYVFDVFVICPLLALLSPVKRCGKSTLLQILEAVTRRPLLMSNITTAALFRTIEAYQPTLLIDEFDTQIQNNEDLRGIINGGHTKHTAHVIRTVGDDFEPKMFSVWSPKVLAGIGSLPDTLDDRSIRIRMKRRAPAESVERLRRDRLHQFEHLKRKATRWAGDNIELLATLDPSIPDLGNDRAADNWRPLIAIADAAGPRWGEIARKAAVELSRFEADDEDTWRILLLEDLRTLFSKRGADVLTSKAIVDFLITLDERPWPTSAKGRPINAAQMASLLKPFEVRPRSIRINPKETKKGYHRHDLLEQFARYLSPVKDDNSAPAPTAHASSTSTGTVRLETGCGAGVAARTGTPQPEGRSGAGGQSFVPACSGTAQGAIPGVIDAGAASSEDVPVVPAGDTAREEAGAVPPALLDDDDDDDDPEGGPPQGGPGSSPPFAEFVMEGTSPRSTTPTATIITSSVDVEALTRRVAEFKGPLGLDLETTGLNPRTDQIRLLSLNVGGSLFLVDCFRVNPRPLFSALQTKLLVGHNLAFDLAFLRHCGFDPGSVSDTYLMSQVLDAGLDVPPGFQKFDAVLERHLGIVLDKTLQTSNWAENDLSAAQLEYAAGDVAFLPSLYEQLSQELDAADLRKVADLENRCLPTIVWTADAGAPLDGEAWQALHDDNVRRASLARAGLDQIARELDADGVNWNSPAQIKAIFQRRGINLPNVKLDTLKEFDDPAVKALAAFRDANSQERRYGPDWATIVDGRIYSSWRQIGAASGRMSCSKPNLQAVPREDRYRDCFAPIPGRVLVRADYSQIELRLVAKQTGDRRLLSAYENGEDLHTVTAKTILGKDVVSKSERQLAKAMNFGLIFGMGAPKFREYARTNYGVALSLNDAERLREAFFETYAGVRRWHEDVYFKYRSGRLPDPRTPLGRRRQVTPATPYTEILNHPIQGGAADGLKNALALLWERRADCSDTFPVLLVHDEIVIETPEDRVKAATTWLRKAMEDGMAPFLDPVPVVVDTSERRRRAAAPVSASALSLCEEADIHTAPSGQS
jgi:DNA polymerase-1